MYVIRNLSEPGKSCVVVKAFGDFLFPSHLVPSLPVLRLKLSALLYTMPVVYLTVLSLLVLDFVRIIPIPGCFCYPALKLVARFIMYGNMWVHVNTGVYICIVLQARPVPVVL